MAGCLAAASPAWAQPPASPPAQNDAAANANKSEGKTVGEVTVMGASPNDYRASIDRKSYGVANDLAATTGSISDALRNVPSVEVDPQGAVSLRGDPNVTILIDGKPSTLFRGAGAALALQSMPADSIERVEVITSPSAEFSPDGSAGIINLITKRTRKAGRSGSVRLNVGNDGRLNGGLTAAYNSNRLTLSANLSAQTQPNNAKVDDARTFLDGQGHVLSSNTTHFDNSARFNQQRPRWPGL
jgi:outer membrane receptor protein involved in Fe transport